MRAAVLHGRGDVRVERVEDAPTPGPDQVRLAVHTVGLCGSDLSEFLRAPVVTPLDVRHAGSGHLGPVILGHEFIGTVLEMGSEVTDLAPGDRVAAGAGVWCGCCEWCVAGRPNLCASYHTLGLQAHGGLADSVTVPARMCVPVPDGLSDEEAALAQPLAVALHALDRAPRPELPDPVVVVNGAGGIGTLAVAGASARGFGSIIAADVSRVPLEAALGLGATDVVDVGAEGLESAVARLAPRGKVDLVIEASGSEQGIAAAIRSTRRGGTVVLVGLPKEPPRVDTTDVSLREISLVGTVAHHCDQNLPEALHILSSCHRPWPVARVVDLEQVVPEGLTPLVEGRAGTGKVVVRVGGRTKGE